METPVTLTMEMEAAERLRERVARLEKQKIRKPLDNPKGFQDREKFNKRICYCLEATAMLPFVDLSSA